MTVSQLYDSVAQLGFEDSLEDNDRFIFSANRALLQVNALRPATSAYVINHRPLKNMASKATFETLEKIDDLYFYAENVKSFYFEVQGNGTLEIEKKAENGAWADLCVVDFPYDRLTPETVVKADSNGFIAYRGLIEGNGAVRMHFSGSHVYSIRNVAMYQHTFSDDAKDIPAYEPFTRYDLSELTDDFLSLASPPIIELEGVNHLDRGYTVENGRVILLHHDMKGLYKVIYNRKPKAIASTDLEAVTNIDLDEDLCALLPVLIASYVWVDDEPEKAQYYLSLYRERAIDIERRASNATPVPFNSINGW